MIRKVLPRWLAWSCYVVALSTSLPAQETLYTQDGAFHIPFNLDQGDQHVDQVRLFYSSDAGETWQLYQQLPADEGRFTFRAETDGQFWFTVRLSGLENAATKTPELKVVVDRNQPNVELWVERDASGRVVATWEIEDANLDRQSVQMHFVTADRQWQPVPVDRSSRSETPTGIKGAAEWWVAPHIETLEVRLQARDLANNLTLIERQFAMTNENQAVTRPNQVSPDTLLPDPPVDAPAGVAPHRNQNGWTSVPGASPSPTPPQDGAGNPPRPPTGRLRTSRERRFKLEYDIDVANQGVHRVEIWYTKDGGQSWKHLGDDPDLQSPHLVQVAEDGIFGFRLVVQATAGFFAQPPVAGDPPDVWVHVDSLGPSIRMTNAEFGGGPDWGTLRLAWESSDESPSEHPVTLLFSDTPEGPWRKLVEGQPSSGVYQWRPDQSMPARFYVRAEAKDRVGNVNGHTWAEPLQSHHLQPRARIRDVRPARNGSLFGTPELR